MRRLWPALGNSDKMKIISSTTLLALAIWLGWWCWPARCTSDDAVNHYLELITQAEEEYKKTKAVPAQMRVENSCITYVPDDTPSKALIWLQLPSRNHIGYVIPNGIYTIADSDFNGIANQSAFEELRSIRNEKFQRYLEKLLPNYSLQPTGYAGG